MRLLRRPSSERGSILVLTAISASALVGITALAIDASYMFDMRHRIAQAADAAALSAALEWKRNGTASISDLTTFAKKEIALHDFTPVDWGQTGGLAVDVNHPPEEPTSPYYNNLDYAEVLVSQSVPTFFMRIFGRTSMTLTARSVAGIGRSTNCLISLKTKDKDALKVEDDSNVVLDSCDAVVNSKKDDGLKIGSKGTLSVRRISISGSQWKNKKGKDGLDCTDTSVPCPQVGMPPIADPLAGLVEPSGYGSAGKAQKTGKNKTLSISAGAYEGLEVEEGGTLQLGSGNYYLTKDGLKTNDKGGTITGTGVMIYIAGGKVDIKANADVTLSAPTSGTYAGILFFQGRSNDEDAKFDDGADYEVSGVFYFPKAKNIEFGNKKKKSDGTLTTDCTIFIGQKIKFKKNADMVNTCSGYGTSPIHTITLAE